MGRKHFRSIYLSFAIFSVAFSYNLTPEIEREFPTLIAKLRTLEDYPILQTVMYGPDILSSLFQTLNQKLWDRDPFQNVVRTHQVHLPKFIKKPINIKFFLQPKNRKSPLLWLFPGALVGNQQPLTALNLEFYHRLGFNVVAFSNVLVEEILTKGFKSPGNTEAEALFHLELMKEIQKTLLKDYEIPSQHLIGRSYGAILASSIFSLSQINHVTLDSIITFSPPSSMTYAKTIVDNFVQKYRNFSIDWKIILKILSQNKDQDFIAAPKTNENAEAILAYVAFLKELKASYKGVSVLFNHYLDEAKLDLDTFMRTYYPASLEYEKEGSLDFWLDRLKEQGLLNKVTLITSKNEPLNPQNYAQRLLENYPELLLVIFPAGGHCFIDNKEFYLFHKYIIKNLNLN